MSTDSGNIRLLVIEDNEGDFVLIEDYLKEEIEVPLIHHARTFSQAKECLESDLNFDAILLDLALPDMKGEALVKKVLQYSRQIPIIVLTGYSDKEFGIKTLSFGISDYLLKDELTASFLHKSIIYSIERGRINLKMKESEEKYSDLFHLSPQPLFVYDVENFKILSANNAAIKQYGYPLKDFLSLTLRDIMLKEDLELMENQKQESSSKKNIEVLRHLKKNGELIYVDIKSSDLTFEGKPARLVLATDVTESVKYIQEIEDQNNKLKEITWLQCHVVRAPLARLIGLVNLLKDGLTDSLTPTEVMNYILTSADELDNIIRKIVKKAEQVESVKNE